MEYWTCVVALSLKYIYAVNAPVMGVFHTKLFYKTVMLDWFKVGKVQYWSCLRLFVSMHVLKIRTVCVQNIILSLIA